jgi:high-affinity nickel-transport protein
MLLRRITGAATDHSHAPGASHAHCIFWKRPPTEKSEPDLARIIPGSSQSCGAAQLLTLGITGEIIPCPAALIVLLSAFALHRIGLGFLLIVGFSVGLAAVLIGFGMLMVYARRFMAQLQLDSQLTTRWLPVASSAFIAVLGLILAVQSFSSIYLGVGLLSRERLGAILFVTGLGLILGMRHSTDADHVVAISTIVSKQRNIRNAAFIGSVWGLGHTITIFLVGSLIILFGVEIPPRLGLSMEFDVAVMLVLLGALNLTGLMQKVIGYLTLTTARPTGTLTHPQSDKSRTIVKRWLDNSIGRFGFFQCLRPLIVGLIHGLAGSAVVALLVVSTIHNPVWATVYLLIFGAGTLIGMMCITAAIAAPIAFAGSRFANVSRYLGVASGLTSLFFGSFLLYQLGFVGGLFTSHPQWTPR